MNAPRHAITAGAQLHTFGDDIYAGGELVRAIVDPRVKTFDELGHVTGSFMMVSIDEKVVNKWPDPNQIEFIIEGKSYSYGNELDRNGLVQIKLREGAP